MATPIPPMPQKSPMVVISTGMLTDAWNRWLNILLQRFGNEDLTQGRQL